MIPLEAAALAIEDISTVNGRILIGSGAARVVARAALIAAIEALPEESMAALYRHMSYGPVDPDEGWDSDRLALRRALVGEDTP